MLRLLSHGTFNQTAACVHFDVIAHGQSTSMNHQAQILQVLIVCPEQATGIPPVQSPPSHSDANLLTEAYETRILHLQKAVTKVAKDGSAGVSLFAVKGC